MVGLAFLCGLLVLIAGLWAYIRYLQHQHAEALRRSELERARAEVAEQSAEQVKAAERAGLEVEQQQRERQLHEQAELARGDRGHFDTDW